MRNFALIGAAGYIAPRHIKAIRDVGGRLMAAVDPHDSVGILDQDFLDVRYFSEIERFDRHLEKLRRGPAKDRVNWVSVCSPNYLHDAHARLAMRIGADVICEKPLVINPWNLDQLGHIEQETGRRVWTILQLRVHPSLVALKEKLLKNPSDKKHQVTLNYITGRGAWYHVSWKGLEDHSGGLAMNIGVHFFDLLLWLFGPVKNVEVNTRSSSKVQGTLELENADVNWFLSVDFNDLPFKPIAGKQTTHRSITIDGEEVEFTGGFTDLHTRVYEKTIAGEGFGIEDARPSIELVQKIRTATIKPA